MQYPARLVPFEQLMYFLDQPNHPNSLGIRLRFEGRIDRDAAIAAAANAFGRHPGFQVTVDPRRLRLVDRNEPFRNFRWLEQNSSERPPSLAPTDIHRDGGGMFWFVVLPDQQCEVALIGNHTLTDGVGGLQVISDWMLEYHRLVSGENVSLPTLQPERLLHRGRLNLLRRKFLSKLIFQPVALFGATKFLFRRTIPLVPLASRAAPPIKPRPAAGRAKLRDVDIDQPLQPYPQILTRRFTIEQTNRLKAFATEVGCTPNDVLTSSVFVAISRWRERQAVQRDRDWIRLLIPMSIRTIADRRLTACNRVSLVQVDRQPRQISDPRRLLRGVWRELRVIREWQLDRTLLLALRIASIIPGQIRRMARHPRSRATSFLTNLGNPFDRLPFQRSADSIAVGNLQLRAVEMIAPMLRGIPAAFAVAEFLNRMTICLNLDPRILSTNQGVELLDELERAIGELLAKDYNEQE
jgi:hypothetical protein